MVSASQRMSNNDLKVSTVVSHGSAYHLSLRFIKKVERNKRFIYSNETNIY